MLYLLDLLDVKFVIQKKLGMGEKKTGLLKNEKTGLTLKTKKVSDMENSHQIQKIGSDKIFQILSDLDDQCN